MCGSRAAGSASCMAKRQQMVCAMHAAWHATQQHASVRVRGFRAGNEIACAGAFGERDGMGNGVRACLTRTLQLTLANLVRLDRRLHPYHRGCRPGRARHRLRSEILKRMEISFSRSTRRWVAVARLNGHFGRSPLLSFLAWDVLQSVRFTVNLGLS